MLTIIDMLLQGILLGGLYALFAAGLTLIFGIMRLVNLAHGDMIIFAAFMIFVIASALGISVFLAVFLALPLMFVFGYVLQTYCLNKVVDQNILAPLLVTFGISIILQNGMLELFSADSQRLQVKGLETASLSLGGGIAVGLIPLLTFIVAIVVILGLNFIFYKTALGRAFRATSDDPVIAEQMGIDNKKIFAIAMGLSMIVVTIAALFLAIRSNFDPSIGPARLLYAFEAVIIGGLGSFWGTLVGGIILGVAQTIGASINPEWQILAGHIAFLIVLVLKPRGLFPRAVD